MHIVLVLFISLLWIDRPLRARLCRPCPTWLGPEAWVSNSQKEIPTLNVGAGLERIPDLWKCFRPPRDCTWFDEIFLYLRQAALRSSRRTSKVDHGVRGGIDPQIELQLDVVSFGRNPHGFLASSAVQLHKCRISRVFSPFFPMRGKVGHRNGMAIRAIEDGRLNLVKKSCLRLQTVPDHINHINYH